MATADSQAGSRLVAIAPAPSKQAASNGNGPSHLMCMPYTCQTCARRKVKCDKASPVCSTCRKSKLECVYQVPQPRLRKREIDDDVLDKLNRYEAILRQHGLLDADSTPTDGGTLPREPVSFHWNEPEPSRPGRLVADEGKSRYIDNRLWRNIADDDMDEIPDEENEREEPDEATADQAALDPLTSAFMDSYQTLLQYHPTHQEAMILFRIHVEYVDPICKVLHVPSTRKMVETASQQPQEASKSDECLLFSMYYFAVYSLSEEECFTTFDQPRDALMQRYHFAARQALVNASFLKTTETTVFQALILFLLACRYVYDSQTYWILTGVAVRIAQRMGFHRDGEKLGVPSFQVEMRRRLFYQLLPLDGNASQLSGTGLSIMPAAWDTLPPLNINDDQIWPGMINKPEEQSGATEMIFCLSRACIGKFFVKAKGSADGTDSHFKDYHEAELAINEAEREVEDKYIRYCDIVNPVHFLTIVMARSGITAMRLRIRLSKVKNGSATNTERRELFGLAQKILDTDSTTRENPTLKKFQWHIGPFFLWGMWDSLIYVLTSLWKRSDLLSPLDVDDAWSRVEQVYNNHSELLGSKRALYVAFGRLTLKAWDSNPRTNAVADPTFIAILRSPRKSCSRNGSDQRTETSQLGSSSNETSDIATSSLNTPSLDDSPMVWADGTGLDVGNDFNIDAVDWAFWDQLIQYDQTQGSSQ